MGEKNKQKKQAEWSKCNIMSVPHEEKFCISGRFEPKELKKRPYISFFTREVVLNVDIGYNWAVV